LLKGKKLMSNFFTRLLGINELRPSEEFFTEVFNGSPNFNTYYEDLRKLEVIFSNPAMLKVVTLQCDLFSLGKIYVYKDGKVVDDDPFLKRIKNPNPFQQTSKFLWDYMFWNMIGNAYCYVDSNVVENDSNKFYFLSPDRIEWPQYFDKMKDKIILSKSTLNSVMDQDIVYRYHDGTSFKFKWKNIIHVPDLTNGRNWFKGSSRIDALYKVISNSEKSLDSKNINIDFSGKYMVAGKADPENISEIPMSGDEQQDIETKMNGRKRVHAVKSMIDIKRFVENIGILKLDDSYLADYFIIGSMYGIPRDVLEAYRSSTYENQEKARGAHVSYCLQPKGDQFFSGFEVKFNYGDKTIVVDWEHLPFMQAFAKERAETKKILVESFTSLLNAGVSRDDANVFLDTEFKTGDGKTAKGQA